MKEALDDLGLARGEGASRREGPGDGQALGQVVPDDRGLAPVVWEARIAGLASAPVLARGDQGSARVELVDLRVALECVQALAQVALDLGPAESADQPAGWVCVPAPAPELSDVPEHITLVLTPWKPNRRRSEQAPALIHITTRPPLASIKTPGIRQTL